MKHIVCLSGGNGSALAAIWVAQNYPVEDILLVNHDIKTGMEHADIKRFKQDIANYIGVPLTRANYGGILNADELPDQFDVCLNAGAITDPTGRHALCTTILKTQPFFKFLGLNFPIQPTLFVEWHDCTIYYGFDVNEGDRVTRRVSIMGAKGYKTDFPNFKQLLNITSTREIGIEPPLTYAIWKHANCIGCLKAGLLHWYVTYCLAPAAYTKASNLEQELDFTIHRVTRYKITQNITLEELRPIYEHLKQMGVAATEHQSEGAFGNKLRLLHIEACNIAKPCECIT